MAEDAGYLRLQEEHAKALSSSRDRVRKWEAFKGDYDALQARLYTLPDKLTHDVMVPFGKFAFMPGKLCHTNEVMVLLGDNWFAKRSTKQALEIAERRKKYVVQMLEEERKELLDLDAKRAFTEDIRAARQEHENVVEIKEECDPNLDLGKRVWRARRPRDSKVPPPRPAFPKVATPTSATQQSATRTTPCGPSKAMPPSRDTPPDDEQLWARLEELEREEEAERKRKEEEEEEEEGGIPSRRSFTKPLVSDDGTPFRIPVKHSSSEEKPSDSVKEGSLSEDSDDEERPLFSTPADILTRFYSAGGGVLDEEGGAHSENSEGEEEEERGVRWDPQLVHCEETTETRGGTLETADLAKGSGRKVIADSARGSGRKATPTTTDSARGSGRKATPTTDLARGSGRKVTATSTLAFTGQVIERTVSTTVPESSENQRKVSKFKASRRT